MQNSVFVLMDKLTHVPRAVCKTLEVANELKTYLEMKEGFGEMYVYDFGIFDGDMTNWKIYNKGVP